MEKHDYQGLYFNNVGALVALLTFAVIALAQGVMQAQTPACITDGAVSASNSELAQDCEALLGMKDTLRGTGTLNWSASRSIYRWEGIRIAGEPRRVTVLKVQKRNLTGQIPAAIGQLDALIDIWLYTNELHGPVPAEVGSLENLKTLMLANNNLSGQLPSELNNLSLDRLWLKGNKFEGCVPRNLANVPDNDLDRVALPLCSSDDNGTLVVPIPTPTTTTGASLSDMVKRVRPAIVKISQRGDLPNAVGSGFIFSTLSDGSAYILTNHDVVDETTGLRVMVGDAMWYTPEIMFLDARRDIAVLQICCGEFTKVAFADSNNLFAGDEVVAIGYANDFLVPRTLRPGRTIVPGEASVTRGMISAFRYDSVMDAQLIQTDIAISRGNSGGPLLTSDGLVVAMNILGYGHLGDGEVVEGLSFSVLETTIREKLRIWADGPDASFGPVGGTLAHDNDEQYEWWRAPDFEATDDEFRVAVTFANPYDATKHDWSYGIAFGIGSKQDDIFMHFVVTSSQRWYLISSTTDGYETTLSGAVPQLETQANKLNRLSMLVDGKYGALFVNDQKVLLNDKPIGPYIDLGKELVGSHGGGVAVTTGLITGTESVGATTRFSDFQGESYSHDND